jgi:hypothetical protein
MALKPEISHELRGLVREVLRDVMADGKPASGVRTVRTVRIDSDIDLQAFVATLIEPTTLEKVRAGRLRFTLQDKAPQAATMKSGDALRGVITEQKIDRLASTGVLVLAPGTVLTPLARDRARKLGLKIERRC